MAYIRAAIVTTAAILVVLVAFIAVRADSSSHHELAEEAFLQGDLAETELQLDRSSSEWTRPELLRARGYLAARQENWEQSLAHFKVAESAFTSKTPESVRLEVFLGQALAAYRLGQDEEVVNIVYNARKLLPESGSHIVFKGLAAYLNDDIDSAIYHFQRPLSDPDSSVWMDSTINTFLDNVWVDIRLAHCYIQQGNALIARQLLERLREEASEPQQSEILYYIGLSYATEAGSPPNQANLPYVRLASSYWKRVSIDDRAFVRVRSKSLAWLKSTTEHCLANLWYGEIPELVSVLQQWSETKQVTLITQSLQESFERHLADNEWADSAQVLTLLQSLPHAKSQTRVWQAGMEQKLLDALQSGAIDPAHKLWQLMNTTELVSEPFTQALEEELRKTVIATLESDSADLAKTRALMDFWASLNPDKQARLLFATELVGLSKTLWLQPGEEPKAFALMQSADELVSADDKPHLADRIEAVLKSVHTLAVREDQVTKFRYILAAVRQFNITSIELADKKGAANYLEDAALQFKQGRLGNARDRAEWVLAVFPEEERAHALMAAISYSEHAYAKAVEHFQALSKLNAHQRTALAISLVIEGDPSGMELIEDLEEAGRALKANDRVRLAYGRLSKRDYTGALSWFETVVEETPEIHAGMSITLTQLGRYDEALRHLNSVEGKLQNHPTLLAARVLCLCETGNIDSAYSHLQFLLGNQDEVLTEGIDPYVKLVLQQAAEGLERNTIAGTYFYSYKKLPSTALYYLKRSPVVSAKTLVMKGNILLEVDQQEQAEITFQDALGFDLPKESRIQVLEALAGIAERQGRWDHVVQRATQILEMDELNPEWRLKIAEAHRLQHQWRDALHHTAFLNQKQLLTIDHSHQYIEALIHTGNAAMARDLVYEWINSMYDIPRAELLTLARVFERDGLRDLGAQLLQRADIHHRDDWSAAERIELLELAAARADYSLADQLMEEGLDLFKSSLRGQLTVAKLFAWRDQLENAMEWGYEALRMHPNHPEVLAFLEDFEVDAAKIYVRAQRLRPSIDVASASVSLQVAYAQQLANYAIEAGDGSDVDNYQRMEALSEAQHLMLQIAQAHDEYPEVQFRLGQSLFLSGKRDKALEALEQALQLDPSHVNALKYAALIQERNNDKFQAMNLLRAATQWDSSDADAWMHLASLSIQQRQLMEARSALLQVVRFQPNNTSALVHLGGLLVEMKNPEDARVVLERAVRIEPRHLAGLTLLLTSLTDPTLLIKDGNRHLLRVQQHEVYTRLEALDPEHARKTAERLNYSPRRTLGDTDESSE